MKHIALISFGTLALAAASLASPQLDVSLDPIPARTAVEITQGLDRVEDSMIRGQFHEAQLAELLRTVGTLPEAEMLRARFTMYVKQLAARARVAYVGQADLANLRRRFVSARLARAIDLLEVRARAGGWSAAQYEAVLSAWVARARVFVDAPDPEAYRKAAQIHIESAFRNAVALAEALRALRGSLAEAEAEEARAWLAARIRSGDALQVDYRRVVRTRRLRNELREAMLRPS